MTGSGRQCHTKNASCSSKASERRRFATLEDKHSFVLFTTKLICNRHNFLDTSHHVLWSDNQFLATLHYPYVICFYVFMCPTLQTFCGAGMYFNKFKLGIKTPVFGPIKISEAPERWGKEPGKDANQGIPV